MQVAYHPMSKAVRIQFNVDLLSTSDRILLAEDLVRKLLETDELQKDVREDFRSYLADCLDKL